MTTPTCYYGILVHTLPLVYAAQAFSVLQSQLNTLDLISLRRCNGTLKTSNGAQSLAKVPQEVWEMVKRELIVSEVKEAEKSFFLSYFVDACDDCLSGDFDTRYTSQNFERCPRAHQTFTKRGGGQQVSKENEEKVKTLLARFGLLTTDDGLVVPFCSPYCLKCYSLVALPPLTKAPSDPSRGTAGSATVPAAEPPDRSLPSNAASRFGALLALLDLPAAPAIAYKAPTAPLSIYELWSYPPPARRTMTMQRGASGKGRTPRKARVRGVGFGWSSIRTKRMLRMKLSRGEGDSRE